MKLAKDPKIAVAIASLGRPNNLRVLLDNLSKQTLLPYQVIVSVVGPTDCPDLSGLEFDVETVFGPKGTCPQRNRAIEKLSPNTDFLVFFDDDFVPSRNSLLGIAAAFAKFEDVNSITGLVLKDGILGPGIPPYQAAEIVEEWDASNPAQTPEILKECVGCYGCNMAFRVSSIGDTRFDEKLLSYAWLEDVDFSARIPGKCIKTNAFAGVHCGEKVGRERNGRQLGYSQIFNPVYLWRKGSIPLLFALENMAKNFLKNHARFLFPEPWVDRRGRTVGNWIGLRDAVFSRNYREDQ